MNDRSSPYPKMVTATFGSGQIMVCTVWIQNPISFPEQKTLLAMIPFPQSSQIARATSGRHLEAAWKSCEVRSSQPMAPLKACPEKVVERYTLTPMDAPGLLQCRVVCIG